MFREGQATFDIFIRLTFYPGDLSSSKGALLPVRGTDTYIRPIFYRRGIHPATSR
jgi:hypothetical protein